MAIGIAASAGTGHAATYSLGSNLAPDTSVSFESGSLAGPFTDYWEFTLSAVTSVSSIISSTIGKATGINSLAMSLIDRTNSDAVLATGTTQNITSGFQVAYVDSTGTLSAAPHLYALNITGTTKSGGGSYGGDFSIAAVPEPHEWAMMLAGLGIVGTIAARRRRAAPAP